MELMSSLLLCALLMLTDQALGKLNPSRDPKIQCNNSLHIYQKPASRKKVLLNINTPPLVTGIGDLQSVFTDIVCRNCIKCMERAIKADQLYFKKKHYRPTPEELHQHSLIQFNDVIDNRYKRSINDTEYKVNAETKRSKLKKVNIRKSVSVTKYKTEGKVHALKVKETTNIPLIFRQNDNVTPITTCQIYNVKKAFSCDSPEGVAILALAKRKISKNGKKEINKVFATSAKPKLLSPIFKKRQIDSSQVPENSMASIEDMY